jgi:serine phosphatase RsbU (regulator of sigma subunit)
LTICWQYQEELTIIHVPTIVRLFGTTTPFGPIGAMMMLAIISVLMMRRFIHSQREREQWRTELEQARQVQQVLIPEALPKVPGFKLASEYRPAQQVGGDFFQILPLESGGVLAVIGDVSGKGMPAAMTVSLLVGTVRTLAHFTTSPKEIVTAMNFRMVGRMQGGFTTCLVLRLEANGALTAANAGHLSPYCDGKEMTVEAGLPLGLSAEAEYPETHFHLGMAQQLTVLTDGIVEARSRNGDLFGFDRTAAMAAQPAASIAQAAQEFGQDDDITVLTLTRLAVGEEAATLVGSTVLAPAPA